MSRLNGSGRPDVAWPTRKLTVVSSLVMNRPRAPKGTINAA